MRLRCTVTASGESSEARWRVFDVAPFTEPVGEAILWGFPAGEALPWSVEVLDEDGAVRGTASGRMPAQTLPGAWVDFRATVQGDPTGVPPVLFRYGCPSADGWAWVDAEGRLRGVQALDGNPQAVSFDGERGVLTILDRSVVEDRGLDGRVRWRSEPSEQPLHHDAHRDDQGLTWVMTAEVVSGVVSDGLVVLDEGGTPVATWQLADHVPPGEGNLLSSYWASAFPTVPDWSHGNSITVADGRGLLSLRWLDAVLELRTDVGTDDFGEIVWAVTGRPSELDSDADWSDGGGWVGQHHPTWTRDGRLMVFDNGVFPERSRVVQVELDEQRSTLAEADSWLVDRHCPVQGAAYELSDGRVLATCATGATAHVFRRGQATEDWSMTLACATAPHRVVPRFEPMEGVLIGFVEGR